MSSMMLELAAIGWGVEILLVSNKSERRVVLLCDFAKSHDENPRRRIHFFKPGECYHLKHGLTLNYLSKNLTKKQRFQQLGVINSLLIGVCRWHLAMRVRSVLEERLR